LQQFFPDQLYIVESSIKYLFPDAAGVDQVIRPSSIEKARLLRDHFEIAYSIQGSMHSRDQIGTLQKIVDSLRIGAEFFLMWEILDPYGGMDPLLQKMAECVAQMPSLFRSHGLEISANTRELSSGAIQTMVWGRKWARRIKVRKIFTQAVRINFQEVRKRWLAGLPYYHRISLRKKVELSPLFRLHRDDDYVKGTFLEFRDSHYLESLPFYDDYTNLVINMATLIFETLQYNPLTAMKQLASEGDESTAQVRRQVIRDINNGHVSRVEAINEYSRYLYTHPDIIQALADGRPLINSLIDFLVYDAGDAGVIDPSMIQVPEV